MSSVTLPVSTGEAFDKLGILEIKRSFLSESSDARAHVQREIDAIEPLLKEALKDREAAFWYTVLKRINEELWEQVDVYHQNCQGKSASDIRDTDAFVRNAIAIQTLNDARFRAKSKINACLSSFLVEQKTHKRLTVYYAGHLESGDLLTCMPLVRYLSVHYDCVRIFVRSISLNTAKALYAADENVELILVHGYGDVGAICAAAEREGNRVIRVGLHKQPRPANWPHRFYAHFYEQADLDYAMRWQYAFLRRDEDKEAALAQTLTCGADRYAFVHEKANERIRVQLALQIVKPSDAHTLPAHLALIERATEIHVVDSSFFCLCQYADLSRVERLVVYCTSGTFRARDYDLRGYLNPRFAERWEIVK